MVKLGSEKKIGIRSRAFHGFLVKLGAALSLSLLFSPSAQALQSSEDLRPARLCAEWEPALGTLIRWPLGIPIALVVELAKEDTLFVTVASAAEEEEARFQFAKWGVDLDKCVFIQAKTNSHWTRDWGPQLGFDEKGVGTIMGPIFKGYPHVSGCSFYENNGDPKLLTEFSYSRVLAAGNEDDNRAKTFIASKLGLPLRSLPNYLTGGNIMVDGVSSAVSTQLMLDENAPISDPLKFRNNAKSFLGLTNYTIVSNPEIRGIQHIDCYAKFLDEETLLVKEVAKDNPEYKCVERLCNELKALKSCHGRPYKIIRIHCGAYQGKKVAAYTNSLILNKKVLVPLFGIASDRTALETFQQAMPGYKVLGFEYKAWYYYDALHCRTMGMFDPKMLRILHRPLDAEVNGASDLAIDAQLDIRSETAPIDEKCYLAWRIKGAGSWNQVPLKRKEASEAFSANIPKQPAGTMVEYYLAAGDASGRAVTLPRSAPDWAFSFKTAGR